MKSTAYQSLQNGYMMKQTLISAIQRYNQDAITYDRVYEITRSILAKDFDKANELINEIQDRFIRLCGKKSPFYKYKKEEDK